MATTDFTPIIKRGAPGVEAHELTTITDTKDPLYDARLFLPIEDAAILNFAAGQIQPVAVMPRGTGTLVIVDGIQRWKRATVINHLSGRHEYTGDLAPIKEAIARLSGTPLGKRIIQEAPSGMRLSIAIWRDSEKSSVGAKLAANIFRADDAQAELVRKVRHMARHGATSEEIGQAIGKSKGTVERYLTLDPDAPRAKKTRGKATRPSLGRITKIQASLEADGDAPDLALLFSWLKGEKTDKELVDAWPDLTPAIFPKASKKAKAA